MTPNGERMGSAYQNEKQEFKQKVIIIFLAWAK